MERDQTTAAALDAALTVAPTVGVLHLAGDTGTGERRRRLASLYGRLGVVLTPSEDGRRQVMADLAVPGSRVRTVPNGVDVPSTPAALPHHRIPRVGALGRLTPQKGFDVLLRAVGALIDRGAQLEVVIGGSGRDEAVLRRAAAGLPVTFGGFIRDVRGFLGGVDLFCLPSGRESMPLALLEAMDEGRPCIATDVGAIAEAVGTDAVVLPPDDAPALTDALARLLADRHCRVALGAQAHRRAVRQFDARVMTARTYAALARVQAEAATAPVGR